MAGPGQLNTSANWLYTYFLKPRKSACRSKAIVIRGNGTLLVGPGVRRTTVQQWPRACRRKVSKGLLPLQQLSYEQTLGRAFL